MKRRGTIFVSLFILIFAFAALGADEPKGDTADKGKADKSHDAEKGAGDKDKRPAADSTSPVADQDAKIKNAREDFLKKWFPLTPEQPKIFADLIAKSPTDAGSAMGQLLGSIEHSQIEKMLKEALNKEFDKEKPEDWEFYQRIKDTSLQELKTKDIPDEKMKVAFEEARKKKVEDTKFYEEQIEKLKTAKTPKEREAIQNALAERGFKTDNLYAYSKHYGNLGNVEKSAGALDAAGKVNDKGQIIAEIKDPKGDVTHSTFLGTYDQPWDDEVKDGKVVKKGRGSLARIAAPLLAARYAQDDFVAPKAPTKDKDYQMPLPTEGDKPARLENTDEAKLPTAKLPVAEPIKDTKAATDTAQYVSLAPTSVRDMITDANRCQQCHKAGGKGPEFSEVKKEDFKTKVFDRAAFDKMTQSGGTPFKLSDADYTTLHAWIDAVNKPKE